MQTFGPALFEKNAAGGYKSAIGTLFPHHSVLVTMPPIHALQRAAFGELAKAGRFKEESKLWTERKNRWEAMESVDLVFEPGDVVLIRPELERLDLAFECDRILQNEAQVPKHRIRFARTHDPRVRQALRERGELWRLFSPASDRDSAIQAIREARVAIETQRLYYYNGQSGTRWLTFQEFADLGRLDDKLLAKQLEEIRVHCTQRNRHESPEISFFAADPLKFGAPSFSGPSFTGLCPEALRVRYQELERAFHDATDPLYRQDDPLADAWRGKMFHAITAATESEVREDPVVSTAVESMLKVRWLPGGRFEGGEFTYESFLPSTDEPPEHPELLLYWDSLARGFIANFIREYGDIEHLNLGRVEVATTASAANRGRRGVYLAELKVRDEQQPRVIFLRLQRWGIAERLAQVDEHGRPCKNLAEAILDTEEYVDYTLDRRLACLQCGMHLPRRVQMRRLTEIYRGSREEYRNYRIPVIYFDRDYLPGIPSNRVSGRKLEDPRYALRLAGLLGRAAAPNLVVGRTIDPVGPAEPGVPLFDNGDEIVVEGSDGLPRDLVLVDHSGAFADWKTSSLLPFARAYAAPVNARAAIVPDPQEFAETYLEAFRKELLRLFSDYEVRKPAFDGLFRHLPYNPDGSLACRWGTILTRLKNSDIEELVTEVKRHIAS